MNDTPHFISAAELIELLDQVFVLQASDRKIAILTDLPTDGTPPDQDRLRSWRETREIAAQWCMLLQRSNSEPSEQSGEQPGEQPGDQFGDRCVDLFAYPNVGTNNGDLPDSIWPCNPECPPHHARDLDPNRARPFAAAVFETYPIILALTRFSATAPLKLAAPKFGFRAATMPGFCRAMIPALKVDYRLVDQRVRELAELLTKATGARLEFAALGRHHQLFLDLRHRQAHASGGLLPTPGIAGNLPSGEAYIVPYEGEIDGDPSDSQGIMPVELDGEVILYRIENNRAIEVVSSGPVADSERERLQLEPAYGNLAELGLGVLADFDVEPIGEILVDEKLGLHIAFGRSDHFGGHTGYAQFNSPDRVVHIDRVYLESTQPQVEVRSLDLEFGDGTTFELMRDNRYTYRPGATV